MDMIRDLWLGDIRLAHTYWFFYILVLMILQSSFREFSTTAYGIPLIAFSMIYTAFMWVAIWRSATKYEGQFFWAAAAKTVVILTIMATIGLSIEAIVEA